MHARRTWWKGKKKDFLFNFYNLFKILLIHFSFYREITSSSQCFINKKDSRSKYCFLSFNYRFYIEYAKIVHNKNAFVKKKRYYNIIFTLMHSALGEHKGRHISNFPRVSLFRDIFKILYLNMSVSKNLINHIIDVLNFVSLKAYKILIKVKMSFRSLSGWKGSFNIPCF